MDTCSHATITLPEPRHAVTDVVFAGATGVGKSSLVNMILGTIDGTNTVAEVSNDACPCTPRTTSYWVELETGLRIQILDTRGLNEGVNAGDKSFMHKILDNIRHLASQQARELKGTLRERTKAATPILVWCIHATKIGVSFHWQQFHTAYVAYCQRNAIPVVVVTQMPLNAAGWEITCRDQLRQLDLEGGPKANNIHLLAVRKYNSTSSPEYIEDSRALKGLITELIQH